MSDNTKITISVTPEQRLRFRNAAKAANTDVSKFCRSQLERLAKRIEKRTKEKTDDKA